MYIHHMYVVVATQVRALQQSITRHRGRKKKNKQAVTEEGRIRKNRQLHGREEGRKGKGRPGQAAKTTPHINKRSLLNGKGAMLGASTVKLLHQKIQKKKTVGCRLGLHPAPDQS
jgi:hypothetical protein